ncbi:group I intron-associated PD-(D/E)XK endonuclease [Candidatus Nanohalococcus occultus]|uniref:group I intron-associated PD-(D/E)XK endonuclease n=1 Tax=Candidatus Nanohalococcus occultus TaxID=2978047 RepID=UPI0039E1A55B
MHTKDVGDLAEIAVAKKVMSLGKSVSFPFGDNERYDLLVDDGDIQKAQVRKAAYKQDCLVFRCYSNHRENGEIVRESFSSEQIDVFYVWCQEIDEVFKIPVEQVPNSTMSLRMEPAENGQKKGVNWAEDYRI